MATETTKTLKAEIERLQGEVSRYRRIADEKFAAQQEADKALKESRVHFAELKERLADSESNLSRLTGYIDRVREDDNARDGFDVVDQSRQFVVPRRDPSKARETSSIDLHSPNVGGQRRRHWTDY
jgi:chromosome segregation ATPase